MTIAELEDEFEEREAERRDREEFEPTIEEQAAYLEALRAERWADEQKHRECMSILGLTDEGGGL